MLLLHGLGAAHQMWRPQISHYPQDSFLVIISELLRLSLSDLLTLNDYQRSPAVEAISHFLCQVDIINA